MAAILSCILLEASAKSESTIMDFLTAISSEFRNVNCEELIGSHLVSTSSELLKAASEDGGTRQSMVGGLIFRICHEICNSTLQRHIRHSNSSRRLNLQSPQTPVVYYKMKTD